MLESGKVLQKRYRVDRQIGQGGMGSVYLATDERFGSTVAIKETLIADDNYRKALKREARLLNSLKHNALPKVSDHFIEDNGQYIVMEYIAGEDLYEIMERSGTAFPINDVRIWTGQLLEALEYLHGQEAPIIHRDIKPQNLKLTPHGQVILLDFGLAKGNPTESGHHTAGNSIFGYSRHYASLEQIQGTGTDPRSDIYSLAATIYHLVTGKAPADALTRVMMVMNEDEDPLVPPHLVHDQVDESFSNAILLCMSLNANLRPQTASETGELLLSEKKVVLPQETRSLAFSGTSPDISTQNTKLMPDALGSGGRKQSEIGTELMGVDSDASQDSVETRIAEPATLTSGGGNTLGVGFATTSSNSGRRAAAAAVLTILLLAGTAVAVNYFWYPFFPASPTAETGVGEPDGGEQTAASPDAINAVDIAETETDPNAESATQDSAAKTETAKQTQDDPAPKSDRKGTGTGDSDVTFADFEEELKRIEQELEKDLRVRNGRLETDTFVFEENGVIVMRDPKRPGSRTRPLTITPKQIEQLTPAQKRRLRDVIETSRKMRDLSDPTKFPKPTQKPPTPASPPPADEPV